MSFNATTEDKRGMPSKFSPLSILAWLIGAGIGRFAGINLVIPLAFSAAAYWLFKRAFAPRRQPIIAAMAVQFGQFSWMLLALLLPGTLALIAPDLVLMALGMGWLYFSMSRKSVVALIIYNGCALAVYGYEICTASVSADGMRGLIVHVFWRVMTVALLVQFLRSTKETPVATPSAALQGRIANLRQGYSGSH